MLHHPRSIFLDELTDYPEEGCWAHSLIVLLLFSDKQHEEEGVCANDGLRG